MFRIVKKCVKFLETYLKLLKNYQFFNKKYKKFIANDQNY